MDFFESQDRARRKTWKLIVLYLISVILMVVAVYLVVTLIFTNAFEMPVGSSFEERFWFPGLFLGVSTIMIVMILAGTLFRVAQLKSGGSSVAQMLGGRKVNPSSTDTDEQRLINVVEEMSIASGVPVPDIYVLDGETSINAFAAGYTTNEAAIGVTRGCMEQLTRDELQGVIAHEFSHIFNGDMRLNIRLIGILNGILLLHLTGMILMRSGAYSGMGRGGSGRGQGNNAMPVILLGLGLLVIGYIGMLFGRMIQSAVSRQREYLADSAAVQYTRNPSGLAGALTKIAQAAEGGTIRDGHAMELSHLFFASSFSSALDKLFATHPPVQRRIQAIAPGFDTESVRKKKKIKQQIEKDRVSKEPLQSGNTFGLDPEALLAAIGTIEQEQIRQARTTLLDIPDQLRETVHDSLGAGVLVYGLLMASQSNKQELFIPDWMQESAGEEVIRELRQIYPHIVTIKQKWYIPLVDMAMPALRRLSLPQYKEFRHTVEKLVREDRKVSLFEFALEKMLVRRLDSTFSEDNDVRIRHHHFKTLNSHIAVLLSALSYASGSDPKQAWKAGLKPIERSVDSLELLPHEKCGLNEIDRALDELAASANPVKKYFLQAAIYCVVADKKVLEDEANLLRGISEALDCPLPMFVAQT